MINENTPSMLNTCENLKSEKCDKLKFSIANENNAQSQSLIVDQIGSTCKNDFDLNIKKKSDTFFQKSIRSVENIINVVSQLQQDKEKEKEKINKSSHSIEEVNNFIEQADIKLNQPVKVVAKGETSSQTIKPNSGIII